MVHSRVVVVARVWVLVYDWRREGKTGKHNDDYKYN